MFSHQGKSRTYEQNLQIAICLSFVAGLVNVTGFLEFKQLTTNVTGHFALFINDIAEFDFWQGTIYFLYIFSFLLGSFVSSVIIEFFRESKRLNVFVIPTLIESIVLFSIPQFGQDIRMVYPNVIVCALLFAMGLQNSYVTKISNAVVRTTHLTGLFTDLGIELSQLFFRKKHPNQAKIISTIKLRTNIISFFFLGGLLGGYFHTKLGWELYTLVIGGCVLLLSLYFDEVKFIFIKAKRKMQLKKLK